MALVPVKKNPMTLFSDLLSRLIPPPKIRWLEELRIQILFAENFMTTEEKKSRTNMMNKKPTELPRFYVRTMIRGQNLRMSQRTNKIQVIRADDGSYCVKWNYPMTFKICIQSLFQNPTLQFRVFQVKRNMPDQEIGVASVPLYELYSLKAPQSSQMRLKIMVDGKLNKGVLCVTKVIN